jgi:hypothetical protein
MVSLLAWQERRGGTTEDYAFPSRMIVRITSAPANMRIGRGVFNRNQLTARRTMARIHYTGPKRRSSTRPPATSVQILLRHTKIENTVRYLGVAVEDALTLAEGMEI